MKSDMNPTVAAQYLFDLRLTKNTALNIPSEIRPTTESESYAVQDALVDMLIAGDSDRLMGYKIACTNKKVQDFLHIPKPLSGRILRNRVYENDAELNSNWFNLRIVEPEFAFRISRDGPVTDQTYTADSILPYLDQLVPAIEVVDHRYNDFTTVGGPALIADNAIFGACVFGDPIVDWKHLNLANQLVSLNTNGKCVATGSGENVLGGPLMAMAWLMNHLQQRGRALNTGDIVITGTATDVYRAVSGDSVSADFGDLGSVSLSFN